MTKRPKNQFNEGDTIYASEVNENFEEVWEELNERFTAGENISAGDCVYSYDDEGTLKVKKIGALSVEAIANHSAFDEYVFSDWINIGEGYFVLCGRHYSVSGTVCLVMGYWNGSEVSFGNPYTFSATAGKNGAYGGIAYNPDNDNACICDYSGYYYLVQLITFDRDNKTFSRSQKTVAEERGEGKKAGHGYFIEYDTETNKYLVSYQRTLDNDSADGDVVFYFTESGGTLTVSTSIGFYTDSNYPCFYGFNRKGEAFIGTTYAEKFDYSLDMTETNPTKIIDNVSHYLSVRRFKNGANLGSYKLHQESLDINRNFGLAETAIRADNNGSMISSIIIDEGHEIIASSFCTFALPSATVMALTGDISSYNCSIVSPQYGFVVGAIVKNNGQVVIPSASKILKLPSDYGQHEMAVFMGNGAMLYTSSNNNDSYKFYYGVMVFPNMANFIGIAQETVSSGETLQVATNGRKDMVESSLEVGKEYFLQYNGEIGTNATGFPIGKAISSTEILLDIK